VNDVLPIIRQSGLAGQAEYVTRNAFFSENPVAIDMMLDVLTDRYRGKGQAAAAGELWSRACGVPALWLW
jgi:hypothetical protein